MVEIFVGALLVFALLLGVLSLLTGSVETGAERPRIPPYRSANAVYIQRALQRWKMALNVAMDSSGALPGDAGSFSSPAPGEKRVGDNNGRVEKEKGENRQFFLDLYSGGYSPEPEIRIRGRVLDFYWADMSRNATSARDGHYLKLPNIHPDEVLALDLKIDDGNATSGAVLSFPNPDGSVDLFVRFESL